ERQPMNDRNKTDPEKLCESLEPVVRSLNLSDCLKPSPDSVIAIFFVTELIVLFLKGGFSMRNHSSSDHGVLLSIDLTELTSGLRTITTDTLPMERALGMQCDTYSHVLVIDFSQSTKQPACRIVPSCIASLFHPLV
ncbi:hypothetical protein CLF_110049, partial [Clonorchis sinensis]